MLVSRKSGTPSDAHAVGAEEQEDAATEAFMVVDGSGNSNQQHVMRPRFF
jgi:hypothetical protein